MAASLAVLPMIFTILVLVFRVRFKLANAEDIYRNLTPYFNCVPKIILVVFIK